MAAIDHSGRFGDRLLITALGWQPGNRTEIEVLSGAAVLRRGPHDQFRVDSRGHVFLPMAARTVLGAPVGGRVVRTLLATRYRTSGG